MNELIVLSGNEAILTPETSKQIASLEAALKRVKEKEEELKNAILKEMEEKGVIKLTTDDVVVSYIAPTDRETFDSKTFRTEHPDMYDDYVKISPVKASLRIKLR